LRPLHQRPSTAPGRLRTHGSLTHPDRRTVRRTGAAALAAVVVLTLGGCGGGGGDDSTPAAAPSSSGTAAPAVPTVVSIGTVAGTGRASYRQAFHAHATSFTRDVGQAADGWFDGGFLGVDYPTGSYPDAFTTFTAQARQDAERQKQLMTTGSLGGRIDGVTTLKRSVTLDVLAPKGHAAGVTARFVLRFATTGQTTKKVTVTGRLFLTKVGNAWRIFGFDVAKGDR
jgi:hypothetical protein